MKKIALIVVSLLIASPAHAITVKGCTSIAELAQSVMKARQVGVPMAEAFQAVGNNTLFQSIVIDAYEKPAFMTKSIQEKVIRDFYDKWFLSCIKAMGHER
ncbi:hypothetical protein D6779_11365 [Candidatus Parcubacteria bacterium]|nr:MAG: hypothetical protein D6779_11365 [Candidatus Parcubacteria bacterium]